MKPPLLAFIQSNRGRHEDAWRALYHHWTFPRTIADGYAQVAGYRVHPATEDSEALGNTVDEICVCIIAIAQSEPDLQVEGHTLSDMAKAFDAVKAPEPL